MNITISRLNVVITLIIYPRERDPVPTFQEAGCAPGRVWTGAENPSLGFDRPAHNELLYRLRNGGTSV